MKKRGEGVQLKVTNGGKTLKGGDVNEEITFLMIEHIDQIQLFLLQKKNG